MYSFVKNLVLGFLKVVFFFRAYGKENIPKNGGILLCANHTSYLDPPAIAAGCPRKLTFMAKEELFEKPFLGRIIRACGAYPIRRGKGDAGAVISAMRVLKSGGATLVFPEGRRVRDNSHPHVKSGIVRMAIQMRVPIIPVYTNGKNKLFGGLCTRYGKPITYEQYYEELPSPEEMERLAEELMGAIYAMADTK